MANTKKSNKPTKTTTKKKTTKQEDNVVNSIITEDVVENTDEEIVIVPETDNNTTEQPVDLDESKLNENENVVTTVQEETSNAFIEQIKTVEIPKPVNKKTTRNVYGYDHFGIIYEY